MILLAYVPRYAGIMGIMIMIDFIDYFPMGTEHEPGYVIKFRNRVW
jgi:hypothetical protein